MPRGHTKGKPIIVESTFNIHTVCGFNSTGHNIRFACKKYNLHLSHCQQCPFIEHDESNDYYRVYNINGAFGNSKYENYIWRTRIRSDEVEVEDVIQTEIEEEPETPVDLKQPNTTVKLPDRWVCECGSSVLLSGKSRHLKTVKHCYFILNK